MAARKKGGGGAGPSAKKPQGGPPAGDDRREELLRRAADATAPLSGQEVLVLCGAQAACDGSCPKGKGAPQPNCLCRLAPPPGGSREHSIWARKVKAGEEPPEVASNTRRQARRRCGGCGPRLQRVSASFSPGGA
jgi:hypothetical protein